MPSPTLWWWRELRWSPLSLTNHPTTLSPLVQLKLHARLNHWSYHQWSEVLFALLVSWDVNIYTLGRQVNCHDYDTKAIIVIIITTARWYFHTIREWTVALSSTSWTIWGRVVSFHQAITLHICKYLDIRQPSIPRFAYYLPIFSIYHPKVNTMKSWQLREWNHLVIGIYQTTTGIWLNKTGIVTSLTLCSYWHRHCTGDSPVFTTYT